MLEFQKGYWIKNKDGSVYQIVDICNCDRCKERGFNEPILSNGDYITNYEYETGFKNWVATSLNIKDLVDNWKDEIAVRSVYGDSIKIYYGNVEWHDGDQWIMEAIDLDKNAVRHFAMRDIIEIY